MRLDLFESLPSRRVCCRASTTNSTAKSRSTVLYICIALSRAGCKALQLYSAPERSTALQRSRALYISTALQLSTLYILYTLPQQLSVSLAGGRGEHNEGTSETQHKKGRTDVHHWDEIGRYTDLPNISRLHSLFVADLQRYITSRLAR